MKDDNEEMPDENNIKNKLDIEDEDIKEPSFPKKSDEKDKKESYISPSSSPIIKHKTPTKSFGFFEPIIKLFSKHERSSSESISNSSESYEQPKKMKMKELSEFQKSFIKSQKENFDKNYNILKNDFRFLEEYETKIFKDTNLDIMFIMDLTGSMGIQKILNNLIIFYLN